jgi:sulfur carrier protein ThiS
MVVVQVHLHADLQNYSPVPGKPSFSFTGEAGITIDELLSQLNIPKRQELLVAVNGISVSTSTTLNNGDRLAIFRPLDGG